MHVDALSVNHIASVSRYHPFFLVVITQPRKFHRHEYDRKTWKIMGSEKICANKIRLKNVFFLNNFISKKLNFFTSSPTGVTVSRKN